MKRVLATAVLGLASLSAAQAATIGYFGGNAGNAITASGNTAQALGNLTAADLSGIQVLWILNGSNSGISGTVTGNSAAIQSFVQAGGVVAYSDRWVSGASSFVVGGGAISFTRNFDNSSNVDVLADNLVTNGPGGVVGNGTLDGGNSSSHGYASLASLPAGATAILNRGGAAAEIVDFSYAFGAGDVYYSTIPADFYFAGMGNNGDSFRNIYGPNLAAYLASLADGNVAHVDEPGALALLGLALVGAGLARRRRA